MNTQKTLGQVAEEAWIRSAGIGMAPARRHAEVAAAVEAEVLARQAAGPAFKPVYLVATGNVYENLETYTRHDVCPPMCDAEILYTAPKAAQPVQPADWIVHITYDYIPPRLRLTIGSQSFDIAVDYAEDEPERMEWFRDMLTKAMSRLQPAQAARVPLTDEQIDLIQVRVRAAWIPVTSEAREFARAIEAAHGITTPEQS
jgi:hypothetical protein